MTILNTIPEKIDGASAWVGADLQTRQSEWLYILSADEISEIEHAARYYLSLGRDVGEITAQDFPLPQFSNHLQDMSEKLLRGIGVEVIRGLPIKSYSQEMAAAIFCGIGAHLGPARSQNAAGHILGHVRDIGADPNDPNARIYQTNARQSFHTDSADVVALMCLQDAKEGGDSLLVSAETIYNEMRATRPDLLALLFDPIAIDRRGEVPEGMEPYMTIPPFSWNDGRLTVFYQRQYIDSAQRFADAMRLTPSFTITHNCMIAQDTWIGLNPKIGAICSVCGCRWRGIVNCPNVSNSVMGRLPSAIAVALSLRPHVCMRRLIDPI